MGYGQVSGKVVYKGTKSGKHFSVYLMPTEGKSAAPLYMLVAPYPGRFHFAEVIEGKYKVEACWSDEPPGAAAAPKGFASGHAGVIEVKARQQVDDVTVNLADAAAQK